MAEPFSIYNTLSRSVEPFEPIEPGKIGLYVCGMTVYDHAHVGHARAMVVFDAFVRYLRHRGWDVTFVRNFTDVDDKIIKRAAELGEAPLELAGLVPPDEEPRVSQRIDDIQALVQKLVDNGHAYVSEGTVWFSVESDDEYGKLSGQNVDELRSADEVPGKRHPADFALWKAARPDEPSWPSPWGEGRPGWHIECSAMSWSELGETFDIHAGGLDLVFPHHENEIAQSECGHGKKYVNYWMHNGLLVIGTGRKMKGEADADDEGPSDAGDDEPTKMGKSLGNVVNVRDALSEYPAEALRLYYLQGKYRSPLPWHEGSLDEALAKLARIYDAREAAESLGGAGDPDQIASEMGEEAQRALELGRGFAERFYGALDNDFNTPGALAQVFELARAVNRFADVKKARKRGAPIVRPALEAFELVARSVGLITMDTASFHEEVKTKRLSALGLSREDIEHQLSERDRLRGEKQYAEADAIRDRLEAQSIAVMDTPEGVEWRIRLRPASDG